MLSDLSNVLKFNPYHDERGRFSSHDGANFVSIGEKFKRREVSGRGALSLDDFFNDPNLPDQAAAYNSSGIEDTFLKAVLKKAGYDGMPTLVSQQELDVHVRAGHEEILRGLNPNKSSSYDPDKAVADFKSGELFVGLGIHANGTYAMGLRGTVQPVEHAVNMTLDRYAKGSEAHVIRMALHKDAKVATLKGLRQERDKELEGMTPPIRSIVDGLSANPRYRGMRDSQVYDVARQIEDANRERRNKFDRFTRDLSVYATIKGYHAIDVDEADFRILLDRRKLFIQKEPGSKDTILALRGGTA